MTRGITLSLSAVLAMAIYGAAYAIGGLLALLGLLGLVAAFLTWLVVTAGAQP